VRWQPTGDTALKWSAVGRRLAKQLDTAFKRAERNGGAVGGAAVRECFKAQSTLSTPDCVSRLERGGKREVDGKGGAGKGGVLSRVSGSHHIFTRPGSNLRITVPVHGNRDLKSGLQRAIMKQSGISEDEL